MRKKISSNMTYFHKYVFPAAWIFFIMPFVIWGLIKTMSANEGVNIIFMSLVLIYITVMGFYFFYRILEVEIDDDAGKLIVSDFRTRAEIPLKDIKNISQSLFICPAIIWITLNQPTEFGEKIAFVPKKYLSAIFFGRRPTVEELQDIAGKTAERYSREM